MADVLEADPHLRAILRHELCSPGINVKDCVIALTVVALLFAGCAGNINPSRQLDDAALAASVRGALQNDAMLRPYTINVGVRKGVVTLTGSVRTPELRDRAAATAQAVPNVIRIENLLTVE